MPALNWKTILNGAAAGLVVIVPAAILSYLIVGDGGSESLTLLFFGLIMFGFATAGYGAGRMEHNTPMAHGAFAALVAFATVQFAGVLISVGRGTISDFKWIGLPLTALIAAGCGVAGGVFADWYRRKTTLPA